MMQHYKKKIIIFSNYDWTIYKFRKNLIKELSSNYEIVIVTKKTEKDYLKDFENEKIYINFNIYNYNIFHNIFLFIKIYFIYKKLKPYFCLHFTNKPNIIGGIVASYLSINYVNNIAWGGSETLNKFTKVFLLLMHKISLRKINKVFFQNNDDLHYFISKNIVNKNQCDTIPGSGVDLKLLNKYYIKRKKILNNKKNFTFVMVSRLIKNKGVNEFLLASKIINKKYKDIKFVLLGEILLNNKLFIKKKYLENFPNVEYLGYQDNVYDLIMHYDCIVLPSYREGVPKTLIEAAAIGLPIVATNVPGCKDVCINNYNGFLCEVKNVNDLASKLELFIKLPLNEKKLMGQNSLKISKKFDEKFAIEKYKSILN